MAGKCAAGEGELSLGLAFEQHLLGEGGGSWFSRPCRNLLCLHYHSTLIPTCKKAFHPFFFISSPDQQVKDVRSPSRCPLRGHPLMDRSGTSAIQLTTAHPYRNRIEIRFVQFLARGEKGRVQNLDMSTLDSSEPWEVRALCDASRTYLASLVSPFCDL